MSFLRSIPRKALPLTRTRFFSTTFPAQKTATEAAKDTLKSVDRTISDAAVKGIEKGGMSYPPPIVTVYSALLQLSHIHMCYNCAVDPSS